MPLTTLASLAPAALVLAGTMGLSGDAPRTPAATPLYCTGCLCQEDRPSWPRPATGSRRAAWARA